MHQVSSKQQALVGIMHRWYEEIRAIEADYAIVVDATDLRARIEYFHDAVRTLTHNPHLMHEKRGRLTVEWLAYDLACLRYIQDKPMAKIAYSKPGSTQNKAAGTEVVLSTGKAGTTFKMPSPDIRAQLSNIYRNYTMLFAALFAETADRNYQTRVSEHDAEVEDLAQVEQMLQMMEQGGVEPEQVEEVIQNLDNEQTKTELMIMLHERVQKKRRTQELMAKIKAQYKAIDQEIAQMDKAHMSYLSGQMTVLQDSKDLVKKLSSQGLNLAGQFLENAMANAAGRGAGKNR